MFEAIDTIARIVGYLTIIYGVIRFTSRVLEDRSTMRSAQAEQDQLERWRLSDPARYQQEMDWQRNLDLKRNGLPTDPGFDEKLSRMTASMNEAMKESSDYPHGR